ncbi:MAG: IPTL-CTERM sorting domain-containing protein, partial [Betaproteobacteria bacterium]
AKAAPPPAPRPTPPAQAGEPVHGYAVQESKSANSPLPPAVTHWALAGLGALVLLGFAWRARRRP